MLELAEEEARRRADGPADAARTARLITGNVPVAMDALREQRGLPWLDALALDVVFGWRQLNKHRAATAAAILSLGLAIGATTAAFRLVDAVLLRPLPVADPDRLFVVATTFLDADKQPDYQRRLRLSDLSRLLQRRWRERADLMVSACRRASR